MAIRKDELQFVITVDMKKYRDDMRAATKEVSDLNDGFKGLTQGSKAYNEQMKKLIDATNKYAETANFSDIAKQKKILEGSLKNLTKGTEEFTRVSAQLDVVRNRYKELGAEINGATQRTTAVAQSVSNLGSIARTGAAAVGAMFAVDTLLNYAQALRALVDEFAGYRAQVSQTLQTTGEETNQATAEIVAITRTFGSDFSQTLQAANALSKEFGITASESLELISKGFLAGGDNSGQFLDMLKEYPAQFAEAGISAERAVAIITQSVNDGVFSDKGADAIKEATIKLQSFDQSAIDALQSLGLNSSAIQKGLGDGSLKTIDVIDQVSEKISGLPENSAVARQAIAGIFGSPGEDAGRAFIESIVKTKDGIDGLIDSTNVYTKAQLERREAESRLAAAQNEVSLQLEQQNSRFNNFLINIKAGFFEALAGAIQFFAYFKQNMEIVKVKFYEMINSLIDATNRLINNGKNATFFGLGSFLPDVALPRIEVAVSSEQLAGRLAQEQQAELDRLNQQRTEQNSKKLRELSAAQTEALSKQADGLAKEVEKAAQDSVQGIESAISEIRKKITATDDITLQIKLNIQADELEGKLETAKDQVARAQALARNEIRPSNVEQLDLRQPILIDTDAAKAEVAAIERVQKAHERATDRRMKDIEKLRNADALRIEQYEAESQFLGSLVGATQALAGAFGETSEAGQALIKISQALAVAQALAAVQASVLALSQAATQPFPANLIAIAGTVTAITTAIANMIAFLKPIQQNQFEQGGELPQAGKGGMTVGGRHAQGGIMLVDPKSGRLMGEVEGGELILSRAFVRKNPELSRQLLAASLYRNGSMFATGGFLPNPTLPSVLPTDSTGNSSISDMLTLLPELIGAAVEQRITRIKVELLVSDIADSLERRARIRKNANITNRANN